MSDVTILPPITTVTINRGPKTADERIARQRSIKQFVDAFSALNTGHELNFGPVIEGTVGKRAITDETD